MASPESGQVGQGAQSAHRGGQSPAHSPAHSAETASQWQLMRWRFGQHKAAVVSLVVLAILYLVAIVVEFVAPYATDTYNIKYITAPPMRVRFFDADGRFHLRPFVYDYTTSGDPKSLRIVQVVDTGDDAPDPLLRARRRLPLLGAVAQRPAPVRDRRPGGADPAVGQR